MKENEAPDHSMDGYKEKMAGNVISSFGSKRFKTKLKMTVKDWKKRKQTFEKRVSHKRTVENR